MPNEQLGASGHFPDGRLKASDEGELTFLIGEEHHNVMVRFGKPVTWLAMTPEQAVSMAQLLIGKARVVARRQGKPLVVVL